MRSTAISKPWRARVAATAAALACCLAVPTFSGPPSAQAASGQPIIQVAPSAARPGQIHVSADFPANQAGRPVALQRKSGSRWVVVSRGKVPKGGWVTFAVPARVGTAWATYRVTAPRYKTRGPLTSPSTSGKGWRSTFKDEFTGTKLNSTLWATRYPGLYAGLRKCSATEKRVPTVKGGRVVLRVKKTTITKRGCPSGVYTNTMISTTNTFMAKYGTFAARIKFSPEQGHHGAFWLQSDTGLGAEIDIAEFFGLGRRDSGLTTFVHRKNTKIGGIRDLRGIMGRGQNPANSYHVYSVDWTPRDYVFRVDGKPVLRTERMISRVPQYIILSQVTSDWEVRLLKKGRVPSPTYVDWVRVWQSTS
jgi:beta-glucanase (GH16 family)